MRFRSLLLKARQALTDLGEKIDRIFLISPSFFALVGGTMLGIVIDLLKTLLSAPPRQINYSLMILLSILCFATTMVSFLFLSVKLDGLNRKFAATPNDLHKFGIRGEDDKGKRTVWLQLLFAFLIGLVLLCLGLAFLALGHFVFRNQGVVDC